jgi:hypothetical protein
LFYFLAVEELADSFKTTIVFYKTTQPDIPEDRYLHVDKDKVIPVTGRVDQ